MTITPHKPTVSFDVPKDYIGRQIEVIAFAKDEGFFNEPPAQKKVSFTVLHVDIRDYELTEALQYKVIKTITQYKEYCNLLEEITMIKKKTKQQQDTIELLTLLIEKWDEEHNTFADPDPVE